MTTVVVNGEGHSTIPAHICAALGLQPGDRAVLVEDVPGRSEIRAANRPVDELKGTFGRHGGPAVSIEQMNAVAGVQGAAAKRSDST